MSISKYMNKAWANFAKNPFVDPSWDWPKVGAVEQKNILNLQDAGIAPLISSESLDALCGKIRKHVWFLSGGADISRSNVFRV
jgi:hypothetical protein